MVLACLFQQVTQALLERYFLPVKCKQKQIGIYCMYIFIGLKLLNNFKKEICTLVLIVDEIIHTQFSIGTFRIN